MKKILMFSSVLSIVFFNSTIAQTIVTPPIFQGNSTAITSKNATVPATPVTPTIPGTVYPPVIVPPYGYNNYPNTINNTYNVYNGNNYQNQSISNAISDAQDSNLANIKDDLGTFIQNQFPYNAGKGETIDVQVWKLDDDYTLDIVFSLSSSNDTNNPQINGNVEMVLPVTSKNGNGYNINVSEGSIVSIYIKDQNGTPWSQNDLKTIKSWLSQTIMVIFSKM